MPMLIILSLKASTAMDHVVLLDLEEVLGGELLVLGVAPQLHAHLPVQRLGERLHETVGQRLHLSWSRGGG